MRPERRPWRQAELGHQVVAVDRERRAGRGPDPASSSAATRARSSSSPSASGGSAAARRCRPRAARTARRAPRRPTLPMNRRTAASRPGRLVAEHVVADEMDDPLASTARGSRSRSRNAPASSAPDRLVAEEVAVGQRRRLADVVERARPAGRPAGRRGAASTVRSVWSQRSSPGTLFWGTPRCAASSGRDRREQPGVGQQPEPDRRPLGAARSLSSSAAIRSPDRCATSGARRSIAASVAGSISKPSVAASRTARTIRSASSSNRAAGSPTARRSPRRDVRPAAERVDEARAASPRLGAAPGHRVDREVAAGEVDLERRRRTRPGAAAGSRRSRGRSGRS